MSLRVVRGSRVGGNPDAATEIDRGSRADRAEVEFRCPAQHCTVVVFSTEAEWPAVWPCAHCDDLATREGAAEAVSAQRGRGAHKTHYEFMMMRRTEAEGEQILAGALDELRNLRRRRRSEGPA